VLTKDARFFAIGDVSVLANAAWERERRFKPDVDLEAVADNASF